jgi:hypothetical protein
MNPKKYTATVLATLAGIIMLAAFITACTVPKVTSNPDGSAATNWVVDPKLETALTTGRAVNTATAPVNPASPFIEIGLGLVAAGAGWVAKRKNDKAAANELLLKTVIQAIDTLDDAKVKEAVQSHAVKVGVEGELNTTVQKVGSGII